MRNNELFQIAIVGSPNVGKSTLMNKITNQEVSIVSDYAGTTSDVVKKRMELLNVGPIVLMDTAGVNDDSSVSEKRDVASQQAVDQANLVLWVQDATTSIITDYPFIHKDDIPVVIVFSKCDLLNEQQLYILKQRHPDACFIGRYDEQELNLLVTIIQQHYKRLEDNVVRKLVDKNSTVVFVTPIDSAAPKNRMIVPQAKLLTEALNNHCITVHCQPQELEQTLRNLRSYDLVICDSQCVDTVLEVVDSETDVTTFSIIECYRKADFKYFIESLQFLDILNDNSRILISESCTHTVSHEDIGQVKIPNLLKKINPTFNICFETNLNFRNGLDYDYIIHCGGCMINNELMKTRISIAKGAGKYMTNYGLFLAHYHGGLDRCINIFKKRHLL